MLGMLSINRIADKILQIEDYSQNITDAASKCFELIENA